VRIINKFQTPFLIQITPPTPTLCFDSMGHGNLNAKKSWDPSRKVNQEKVWRKEVEAREERMKIQQKMKELAEERQIENLRRLQMQSKNEDTDARPDWMYAAPGRTNSQLSKEKEDYLLGRRKPNVSDSKQSGTVDDKAAQVVGRSKDHSSVLVREQIDSKQQPSSEVVLPARHIFRSRFTKGRSRRTQPRDERDTRTRSRSQSPSRRRQREAYRDS
jgi:hypothetical protein